MPITPLGRPRDNSLHPPVLSHSRHPSPLHTSSPLYDPQRPPLFRPSSSTSSGTSAGHADDEKQPSKEQRRADRRASPLIGVPMPRPQTHKSASTPPSSSFQASSPAHHNATSRPQAQPVPSLRLSSPYPPAADSESVPMPVPQPHAHAHGGPLPSPSNGNAHRSQPQSMPRAQAHAPPQPSPGATSTSRSHPQPPSAPSQPAYANPAAPPAPAPSVSLNSSAIYGAPASRHTTDAPRARRQEHADAYARGGYGGAATRGTSKRSLASAMVATPSAVYAQS